MYIQGVPKCRLNFKWVWLDVLTTAIGKNWYANGFEITYPSIWKHPVYNKNRYYSWLGKRAWNGISKPQLLWAMSEKKWNCRMLWIFVCFMLHTIIHDVPPPMSMRGLHLKDFSLQQRSWHRENELQKGVSSLCCLAWNTMKMMMITFEVDPSSRPYTKHWDDCYVSKQCLSKWRQFCCP